MKTCKKCNVTRPKSHFGPSKRTKDELDRWCRECVRARKAHYESERPGRRKNSALKSMYGITLKQYNELLKLQNGVCAICNKPETASDKRGKRSLAVDHDHLTGKIRGLLCLACNRGLGFFLDNDTLLKKASHYVTKHS